MYNLLNEIDTGLHSYGSAYTPSFVRDESGVVYKRSTSLSSFGNNQATASSAGDVEPSPKRPRSQPPNFRRVCDMQTDCLENLLTQQLQTNELLVEIRDSIISLNNSVESLNERLASLPSTSSPSANETCGSCFAPPYCPQGNF